ncbi:ketopantoate reductase PanE/ApbA C terminal-domain-containing protein [Amylostereum chailletii]|nr:ketopantoate reductase PanE/ApbA C terminal-domain-containing protein [Amylostereum chailletii]
MPSGTKEILLVGYGAVGACYAFILKRSGLANVTVVARGNYDIVTAKGMDVHSEKYGKHDGWRPDRVVPSVSHACDRAYDYVIVATKAIPELLRTPALLTPLLKSPYTDTCPQPTYVILQNGFNVEGDLYEAVRDLGHQPRILGTTVYIGTKMEGPNKLIHSDFAHSSQDRVSVGMYRHEDYATVVDSPEEEAATSEFANLIKAGGGEATPVPDIQRAKFSKLFWSIAFASTAGLTRFPLTALWCLPTASPSSTDSTPPSVSQGALIEEHSIPTLRGALMELVALGTALGFPQGESISPKFIETTFANTAARHRKPDNGLMPSMLVDVLAGRPIEVEVIFGEVVRLARSYGVDTPRIDMMYALLLVIQNQMLQERERRSS